MSTATCKSNLPQMHVINQTKRQPGDGLIVGFIYAPDGDLSLSICNGKEKVIPLELNLRKVFERFAGAMTNMVLTSEAFSEVLAASTDGNQILGDFLVARFGTLTLAYGKGSLNTSMEITFTLFGEVIANASFPASEMEFIFTP